MKCKTCGRRFNKKKEKKPVADVVITQQPAAQHIGNVVHVDGGAFVEPPDYKFHDAYFSVCSPKGELIHFEKNIGDVFSAVAEYRAIEWAVRNIKERPLTVYSDCTTAIVWAKKGKEPTPKIVETLPPLDLTGVSVLFMRGNAADLYNASFHSPKRSREFYIKRYYDTARRVS